MPGSQAALRRMPRSKHPKLSPAAQSRVSKKIRRLEESGEATGEKAVAMAHSMERAGRLSEGGAYIRAKRARRKAHGR